MANFVSCIMARSEKIIKGYRGQMGTAQVQGNGYDRESLQGVWQRGKIRTWGRLGDTV